MTLAKFPQQTARDTMAPQPNHAIKPPSDFLMYPPLWENHTHTSVCRRQFFKSGTDLATAATRVAANHTKQQCVMACWLGRQSINATSAAAPFNTGSLRLSSRAALRANTQCGDVPYCRPSRHTA